MATETLTEELARAPRSIDMAANPFLVALANGTCTRETIRRYAVETYVMASIFPQRLAAIAAICPDPSVRLELLRNLLEEEGVTSFDGERIARREERRHSEIARRFARAAGASDDDMARARENHREETWVERAIGEKRLCAALAYLTIGFEGCVPPTYRLLVSALQQNYGFTSDDLEFLILHMTADVDHSRHGAEMTAALVRSDADRDEAMTGARHGTTAWWWWHKSFAR